MKLTVGIPIYNEEKSIVKTINSIIPQLSEEDEIIIIASGCTDNSVREILKIKDTRIEVIIESERKGKSSAINLIIKNAKGDIIIQTDGDVELDKDAINNIVQRFSELKVGGISGHPISIINNKNLFYDWTQMSYRKIHEIRLKENNKGTFWHMSGYLLAFRKEALKEVPFVKGAVDAWMGKIIKDNGYIILYEPEAKVFVKAPLNIKDFISQKARVRAGYSAMPEGPRTIGSEILYFPIELFKIPLWRWPKFIFSAFIYAYCWIKGKYMTKTNKSLEEIWKVPTSTK